MRTSPVERVASYLVLTVMALGLVTPLLGLVLAAFHPPGAHVAGLSWPERFSWGNLATAWQEGHFASLMGSSLIVCAIVVPLTVLLATLAGYGLGAMRTPGRTGLGLVFLLGLTLPIEVVIVPLYHDLRQLHLTDSLITLSLVEAAAFLPFGVYWMRRVFAGLPTELVEQAVLDGASPWQRLRWIQWPLARPAVATLAVLYFMWAWNQFLLVVTIVSDPNRRTAPAGLGFFVAPHSTDLPLLSAASLIVIGPIVAVYLIFQRQFVAGLLAGASR
ncbi:MAG: carbohydrate ABC transporter permease [Propionibacteriaceae bacterium]|jgi:raffinose/stachyose/melibiose transport system permease protein|nr:carbohydrate ABC transporter permease [Propionibacteriaceae bacterium]